MATITLPAPALRRSAQRSSRPAPPRPTIPRPTPPMPYRAGDLTAPTLVLPRPSAISTQAPARLDAARSPPRPHGRHRARARDRAGRLGRGSRGSGPAGDGPATAATTTVVIQPGQTLWQVARTVAHDADPRETMARIAELNGLSGADAATLRPGQPSSSRSPAEAAMRVTSDDLGVVAFVLTGPRFASRPARVARRLVLPRARRRGGRRRRRAAVRPSPRRRPPLRLTRARTDPRSRLGFGSARRRATVATRRSDTRMWHHYTVGVVSPFPNNGRRVATSRASTKITEPR